MTTFLHALKLIIGLLPSERDNRHLLPPKLPLAPDVLPDKKRRKIIITDILEG